MKKIALSLFVVAASAAYVLDHSRSAPSGDPLGPAPPTDDLQTASLPRPPADAVVTRPAQAMAAPRRLRQGANRAEQG